MAAGDSPGGTTFRVLGTRAFAHGRLSDEAAERIAEHLDQCPDCEGTVSSLERIPNSFVDELLRPLEGEKFVAEPALVEASQLDQKSAVEVGTASTATDKHGTSALTGTGTNGLEPPQHGMS